MRGSQPDPGPPGRFQTTCWSVVLAAKDRDAPGAREALAVLCSAYWYPLYVLIRRKGHDPDRAADLTQEFFARLLEKDSLRAVDPGKGQFRAFLLAACTHFLANDRDRARALKRGGGRPPVSVDARDAEGRYRAEPAHDQTPERLFDRRWALTLLEQVFDALRGEYDGAGKGPLFDRLKATLTADPRAGPHAVIAGELGMTEGAVQVAAHRLRRRYRALLRAQVALTVNDPSRVDDEIRDLFAALAP